MYPRTPDDTFFALVLACFYALPHLLIAKKLTGEGKLYYPVTMNAQFDVAANYAPHAKFKADVTLFGGDINIEGNENTPPILPLANGLLLASFIKIAGSIGNAIIVTDVLFPALILLITYGLMYELVHHKTIATFTASLFLIFPDIVTKLPPRSFSALHDIVSSVTPFLHEANIAEFTRFDSPKVTMLFFTFAVFATLRALRQSNLHSIFVAGLSYGLLSYSYMYSFGYMSVALSIATLLFFIFGYRHQASRLSAIMAIGITLSLGYVLIMMHLTSIPTFSDLLSRLGLEIANTFRVSRMDIYLRALGLVAIAFFLYLRTRNVHMLFLVGFMFAVIVGLNIQILTGRNLQPWHWSSYQWYLSLLMLYCATMHTTYRWVFQKSNKVRSYIKNVIRVGMSFGIIFIFVGFGIDQYRFAKTAYARYEIDDSYLDAYNWLTTYTSPRSTVATPSIQTNIELQLHTRNALYLPNGPNTLISNDELWQRFLMILVSHGYTWDDAIAYINSYYPMAYTFQRHFNQNTGIDSDDNNHIEIPKNELVLRKKLYEQLQKHAKPLRVFPLQYFIFGHRESALGTHPVLFYTKAHIVYEKNGVFIYEISPHK